MNCADRGAARKTCAPCRIIAKGAPEAIFARCARFRLEAQLLPMDHAHIGNLEQEHERLCADGSRAARRR